MDFLISRRVALATFVLAILSRQLVAADAPLAGGCAFPVSQFTGVGGTNTSVTAGTANAALTAFEAAIGGANNGANPPPQTTGFRTINWDGVLLDGTDFGGNSTVIVANKVVAIPTTRFQARGVLFDRMHAVANDGFLSVNPGASFTAFSPTKTFAPFNNNTVTVSFVLAGTATPAMTRGFGAIFLDVEDANTTSIEYFNGTTSLGKFFAPTGTNGQAEFLGELFNSTVVTSVQITLGTAALFNFNGTTFSAGSADAPPGSDQVALDDFVYAEPTTPAPVTMNGKEGSIVGGTVATFTDTDPAGIAAQFTATIHWGDAASTSGTITSNGSCFDVSGSHTYAEEGTYPIIVNIFDSGGSTLTMNATALIGDATILPGCPGSGTSFIGVGGTNISVTAGTANAALTAFKAAIGGVNNGGNPPPQTNGFRTINWDGVLLDGTDFGGNSTVIVANKVVAIPTTRFQARGVLFDRMHAVANDGFLSVNPGAGFTAFSPTETFAPFNNNTVTVSFVLAGTATPAMTRGFGAIFLDVEDANTTSIEYFNGTTSLGKFFAPTGTSGQAEFLGELFNSPVVTSVQITLGTAALFNFNGTTFSAGSADAPPGSDQVALDDFVYAEPSSAPTASVSGTEGTPLTAMFATFGDLGADTASAFTAAINWGDGLSSGGTVVSASAHCFNVSGTHTYAEEGTFPISIVINDIGSSTLTMNATATIADATLAATGQSFAAIRNASVTPTVATFTDADPAGIATDYTATINWGDSTSSAGTISGSGPFTITGTHTYTTTGAFPVSVTVNDAGASASASETANVGNVHGDANGDGLVNVADVFYLINFLFTSGPAPVAGDENGDAQVSVADVFYLINYLFANGPPPL